MKCIIIEDEMPAIERLEQQLLETGFNVNILARIGTVQRAVEWLSNNQADLIFMDIELGDGLSFEIFDHIQVVTPIIFTTSFDQYTLKAFEQNSLSYLLKPIKLEDLRAALNKFRLLNKQHIAINEKIIPLNPHFQTRFLVRSGNVLQPLSADDIAYLYIENRFLFMITHSRKQYTYDSTMEILEQRLDPEKFFRINRSFIVRFEAVKALHVLDRGKLRIETNPGCKEDLVVSVNKTVQFKNWLDR